MKVKTVSALAGLGGAMILSTSANAAYQGLVVLKHTTVTLPAGTFDSYRVYAKFSDAGDYLLAVSGSPLLGTMTIQNRNAGNTGAGTGFFNPAGTNSAPVITGYSPAAFTWETFVTIGGPVYSAANITGLSPNFPEFAPGTQYQTGDASWFATGPTTQGSAANGIALAGGGFGVMMMQLTVATGENVRGTVAVTYLNNTGLAGTTSFSSTNQTFDSFGIPAPGAFALLGVAGLVGSRRRRA